MTEDRPLYVAPHWRNGAIGCAKWAGVKVRDVLRECGMDVDAIALGKKSANAKIANFIAYDTARQVSNMQVLFLSRRSSILLATLF